MHLTQVTVLGRRNPEIHGVRGGKNTPPPPPTKLVGWVLNKLSGPAVFHE